MEQILHAIHNQWEIGQRCPTFTVLLLTFVTQRDRGMRILTQRKTEAGAQNLAHHSREIRGWSHPETRGALHYGRAQAAETPAAPRQHKSTSYCLTHILLTVHFNKLPGRLISTDLPAELNKLRLILERKHFSWGDWRIPKFVFRLLIRAEALKRTNKCRKKKNQQKCHQAHCEGCIQSIPKLISFTFKRVSQYLVIGSSSGSHFKRFSITASIIRSAKICWPHLLPDHQFSTIQAWDECVGPLPESKIRCHTSPLNPLP